MHESRASIYQLVSRALRQRIEKGEFAQGQKFLTEREIASQHKVSRPTANKILTSLMSEGLIAYRKGVGTFVNSGVLDYDLRRLVSFTEKARAAGRKPATKVLKFSRTKASHVSAGVAAHLNAGPDEELFYFERLRLANGQPVILERRHVVARFCPKLNARDLSASLYALWTKRFGLSIGGAEQFIQAVNLDAADAKLLKVPRRAAALQVAATGFLSSKEPLWYEQTTYRSDAYEFHTVLGGICAPRPAVGQFTEIRARTEDARGGL